VPTDETASVSLALVLTAAGAVGASALVTGLVQLVKTLFPKLTAGRSRVMAFALSYLLVAVAVAEAFQSNALSVSIPALFGAFVAGYGIARLSIANFADVVSEPNSLTGPKVPV
jgi:hypothetical protein